MINTNQLLASKLTSISLKILPGRTRCVGEVRWCVNRQTELGVPFIVAVFPRQLITERCKKVVNCPANDPDSNVRKKIQVSF